MVGAGERTTSTPVLGRNRATPVSEALAIGFRALSVSARESVPEDERLSSRQMGLSMAIAALIFDRLPLANAQRSRAPHYLNIAAALAKYSQYPRFFSNTNSATG